MGKYRPLMCAGVLWNFAPAHWPIFILIND
jgi:hypothetical protein